jgi:cell division protein ZapA (FtsZ GTPase activity inhibitor)
MSDKTEKLDWATEAALNVLDELSDRKGIGNEIDQCDDEIKEEILETLAEIIRNTEKKYNPNSLT